MLLVKTLNFLVSLFLGKQDQKKLMFRDVLDRKEAFGDNDSFNNNNNTWSPYQILSKGVSLA